MRPILDYLAKLQFSLRFVARVCIACIFAAAVFIHGASAQSLCVHESDSPLTSSKPPKMPVEEIIRKFAANDTANRGARNHYSFTEDITIQTVLSGSVEGEYRTVTNISYDAHGARIENAASPPVNSLSRIQVSQKDLDEIRNIDAFFLPTEDLPKYKIAYEGTQHIDEIDAYAFAITPRKINSSNRQFEGCVWVEDRDMQIVKVRGSVVPDSAENQSPIFETYREQIDGQFWFPTFIRADGILHFKANEGGTILIREIVKFTRYKQPG
jgi:hypothetical protein